MGQMTGGYLGGGGKPYDGPDRRRTTEDRRQSADRREMIRFEPEKEDRRKGKDRRADSWGKQHSRY
jgi:hypothetical protein